MYVTGEKIEYQITPGNKREKKYGDLQAIYRIQMLNILPKE